MSHNSTSDRKFLEVPHKSQKQSSYNFAYDAPMRNELSGHICSEVSLSSLRSKRLKTYTFSKVYPL